MEGETSKTPVTYDNFYSSANKHSMINLTIRPLVLLRMESDF